MSTKIVEAAMHCTQQQPDSVIDLGIRIRDGLYSTAGVALYPLPTVDETTFNAQLDAAMTARLTLKTVVKKLPPTEMQTYLHCLPLLTNCCCM